MAQKNSGTTATATDAKAQQKQACPSCDEAAPDAAVYTDGLSGKGKNTPRSPQLQKSLVTRCNRAIGQLNGVKSMIEQGRYCGDVLTQLAAVESAVKAISREVMQDHLETCVVEEIQKGDTEIIDEVMRLFKKFM